MCAGGHVVLVTPYPSAHAGSPVIMRELLSQFDPGSYSLVTLESPSGGGSDAPRRANHYQLLYPFRAKWLNRWFYDLQMPLATLRMAQLVRRLDARVIVGVFPSYHGLALARRVAAWTGTPLVTYLHDTLAESMAGQPMARRGNRLQRRVFQESSALLVMSQGMADLYLSKYKLLAQPLEHIYTEPVGSLGGTPPPLRQAFWGGAVYRINQRGVGRVAEALGSLNVPFTVATRLTLGNLRDRGVCGSHLRQRFFPKRPEYLAELQKHGLMVLALDWPDESGIHEDELATIFPTKTPEYLASGRPILVHCPEHYFLARFFQRHQCGLVVSQRSPEALADASRRLLDSAELGRIMGARAREVTGLFSAARVSEVFRTTIAAATRAGWGARVGLKE